QEGKAIYNFPRPVMDSGDLNFSFSGLKSSVINFVHNNRQKNIELDVKDVSASFQEAVIDVLINKTKAAIEKHPVKQLIIGGGVAANKGLRRRVFEEIPNVEIIIPKMQYCTDNAAMIAAAAYYKYKKDGPLPNYLLGGYST
ncbi:MAG TPA: carbamoyltransferase N-terminal domain-containing protein, partial [Acholeplasmataceae bacterium]|nr:carbamoyltransferase N-terminal domain-containing protein [Acholeplasmataceae bacterium]